MELDENIENLVNQLDKLSSLYRKIAQDELYSSGSIDKIYDCVRHSRNTGMKSHRARRFNSVF